MTSLHAKVMYEHYKKELAQLQAEYKKDKNPMLLEPIGYYMGVIELLDKHYKFLEEHYPDGTPKKK